MNYEQIEISKINRSAYNPRRVFDDSKIAELAHNIREQGLLQPITVRPIANGYEIVCGERRWRAFQWNIVHGYTGYLTMPCIVREMTDDEAFDNTYKLAEAKIEGEIKRRMEKLRAMGYDENGKKLETI